MTVCGEKVTGVCVLGKCPHFKRCCPVIWDKYGKIKPKTNEEWFCSLPTEEKAKFLREMVYYGCLYDEWEQQSITENVPTEVIIVKWLKQPHTIKE